ncbi:unnamed protein product [Pleuronectes platessa]|uniref:Uncharacterized protein n=1 Tax=Pleuronectes platessa TaxID=8262 RepID=A0A9N7VCT8_PLEPL|nr:unnamed protein product [Pleuronectes platessa]
MMKMRVVQKVRASVKMMKMRVAQWNRTGEGLSEDDEDEGGSVVTGEGLSEDDEDEGGSVEQVEGLSEDDEDEGCSEGESLSEDDEDEGGSVVTGEGLSEDDEDEGGSVEQDVTPGFVIGRLYTRASSFNQDLKSQYQSIRITISSHTHDAASNSGSGFDLS